MLVNEKVPEKMKNEEFISKTNSLCVLELIIINHNMNGLICNKYVLYNRLSNYIRYEVIKLCIINRV
jgi:hypothetical protein